MGEAKRKKLQGLFKRETMIKELGGMPEVQKSVAIDLTDKQSDMFDRRIKEKQGVDKQLIELDEMHKQLESLSARSQGKVDGFVEVVLEGAGYDVTKMVQYHVDTDTKKLIVSFQKEESVEGDKDQTNGKPADSGQSEDSPHLAEIVEEKTG